MPIHNQIHSPAVIQVVGYKNTGKTTIVCRLTERLKQSGYSVATMKHDAHDFEIDRQGTDTWRHTQAGADVTIITSPHRTAVLQRQPQSLEQLVASYGNVDWVLAEGFKTASYPKLIIVKNQDDVQLLTSLHNPIAMIAWPGLPDAVHAQCPAGLPIIDLNDTDAMIRLLDEVRNHNRAT